LKKSRPYKGDHMKYGSQESRLKQEKGRGGRVVPPRKRAKQKGG
jgi:hypothetical protein